MTVFSLYAHWWRAERNPASPPFFYKAINPIMSVHPHGLILP